MPYRYPYNKPYGGKSYSVNRYPRRRRRSYARRGGMKGVSTRTMARKGYTMARKLNFAVERKWLDTILEIANIDWNGSDFYALNDLNGGTGAAGYTGYEVMGSFVNMRLRIGRNNAGIGLIRFIAVWMPTAIQPTWELISQTALGVSYAPLFLKVRRNRKDFKVVIDRTVTLDAQGPTIVFQHIAKKLRYGKTTFDVDGDIANGSFWFAAISEAPSVSNNKPTIDLCCRFSYTDA